MKITKRQLKKIIKEELEDMLDEQGYGTQGQKQQGSSRATNPLMQGVLDAQAKNKRWLPTGREREFRPNPNYDPNKPAAPEQYPLPATYVDDPEWQLPTETELDPTAKLSDFGDLLGSTGDWLTKSTGKMLDEEA